MLPRYPNKDLEKAVRSWSHEAGNRGLELIGVDGIRAVGTCRKSLADRIREKGISALKGQVPAGMPRSNGR